MTVKLETGDQPIVIETRGGAIHTRLGLTGDADATLRGEPRPILGLLFGMLDLAEAQARGVVYTRDPAILDRIASATPLLRGGPAEA
ncbi:MAG: hypothetical protein ACJ780_30160 [Solirubrobacteraceae bacterium]